MTENRKNASRASESMKRTLAMPDWTTLSQDEPFFNSAQNVYSIVVQTDHAGTGGGELPARLEAAKEPGARAILKAFEKEITRFNVDALVSVAIAEEWSVPERPNPEDCAIVFGLKILVNFPAQDFDAIEFAELTIPEQALPQADSELMFTSIALASKAFGAVEQIFKIAEKAPDAFSFVNKAVQLQGFVGDLENLLILNGVAETEDDDLIILGLQGESNLLYVLVDRGQGPRRMFSGFDKFKESENVNEDVFFLLASLDDILSVAADIPWTQFLQSFIKNPPEIRAGASDAVETSNRKTDNKLGTVDEVISNMDETSIKLEDEKNAEDEILATPELKQTIFALNETQQDFVGDTVFQNVDSLLENVNTLDDLYQEIFNKVGIDTIVSAAMKCVSSKISLQDSRDALSGNLSQSEIDSQLGGDSGFPSFSIPTVTLPDNLPTTDIMSGITDGILSAVIEGLTSALIGVVKNILQDLADKCGDLNGLGFGEADIIQLASEGLDIDNLDFPKFAEGFLNSLAPSVQDMPQAVDQFCNMLDDLSNLLSPQEISNLLDGNPNRDTERLVNCLVETKYSALEAATGESGKRLFENLGNVSNKTKLIRQIAIQPNTPFKDPCDTPDDDPRRILLENKGLTSAQVDEQIAMSKQRNQERLSELAALLNNDNALNDITPDAFCSGGVESSLIDRDPPSLQFMLDKTIGVIFDGVHMAFNQDIGAFASAITEPAKNDEVQRSIPRKIPNPVDPNADDIVNPEFLRLVAQGVSVDEPDNYDGDPVQVSGENPIDEQTKNFVAKGLRRNLLSIESDSALFDSANGVVSFVIPNVLDPSTLAVPPGFRVGDLPGVELLSTEISQLDVSDHIIQYVFNTNAANSADYIINIAKRNNAGQVDIVNSFRKTDQALTQDILDYTTRRQLVTDSNISLQQSFFGDLVAKIWKGGAFIRTNGQEIPRSGVRYAQGVGGDPIFDNYLDTVLRPFFQNNLYNQVLRDIVSSFTKQIALSPLFRSDVLSLIDFTPERIDDCDPHLLDIQSAKDNMQGAFMESSCEDPLFPSSDGLGGNQSGPLQQSGIESVVIMTIRLYVLDFLLRTIFAFSEFNIQSLADVDPAICDYFVEEIVKAILNIDPMYAAQFQEKTLEVYNARATQPTQDPEAALKALVCEQINSVSVRLAQMVGSRGDIDLNKIFVEEWLPLYDIKDRNDGFNFGAATSRFSLNAPAGILSDIINNIPENQRKGSSTSFGLENGNFILEKYVRINDSRSRAFFNNLGVNRGDELYGVVNLDKWNAYLQQLVGNLPANTNISDVFDGWSYGLRLSYVPPFLPNSAFQQQVRPLNGLQAPTIDAQKLNDSIEQNKAFVVSEAVNTPSGLVNLAANVFPIVDIETRENLQLLDTVVATGGTINVNTRWENDASRLASLLQQSEEYELLFKYCFPIQRFLSLALLYNIIYLSDLKAVQQVFDSTKTQLKTAFQALLNAGDYRYEDQFIEETGGNAGAMTTAQNNFSTDNDTPGISLAAIAARTPILILKGLVEIADTNIGRAKGIVDKAKENGKDIPILRAALGQLPMNVFPPPPFGPGIGPPITPLGFLYLALNVAETFNAAQGKKVKQETLADEVGISSFTEGAEEACEE